MSSLWRRQIVTAARPFLPHFSHAFPAFPAVPFGLAGVGTVGLTPLGQERLPADRTGPQLRGDTFRCQRRLKLRVKRQDSLTEITAVRPCPAPVSYTHLDVYKRQVMGNGQILRAVHGHGSFLFLRCIHDPTHKALDMQEGSYRPQSMGSVWRKRQL